MSLTVENAKAPIKHMSLLEHLEELRWSLIKSIIAIIICAIPCGFFWGRIFDIIMIYPLRFSNPKPSIIYTNPTETVLLSIKIAIAGGIILSTPYIFYQIWKFVSPGLYKGEKRFVLPTVAAASLSFLAGIFFCYLTLPLVLRFLTGFASERLNPFFRANEYMGFLIKISLAFGLVFELPVISFVLAKTGLITSGFLLKNIRYALVGVFITAALLSPPDFLCQLLLAAPLIIRYVFSILIAHLAGKGA